MELCYCSRSCTYTLFVPQGVEIELIVTQQAMVSKVRNYFHYCYIWVLNLAIGQISRSCTYTFFLLLGVEIEIIFPSTELFSLYGQRIPSYGLFFKISIFEHETWTLAKGSEVAHILRKLPPSPKFHSVLLYMRPFLTYWQFFIFPAPTQINFNLCK